MGRGDFGFDGLYSLQAVNQWIGVINANLNAANRTGYKATKVKFRGGVATVERRPFGPLLGIQSPETTLQIDETQIDFSQGSIIASTEPTHLAIQGKNAFFRLSTTLDIDDGAPVTSPDDAAYYTRDGEFHVISVPTGGGTPVLRLVHSTGMYLVADDGAGNLLGVQFDAQNDLVRIDSDGNGTIDATDTVFDETNLQGFSAPNFLRFSRFGSTVFEQVGNANDAGDFNVAAGQARVVAQSLESSNSSLSQALPELSLAQKFFSSVSKVISVHQTNLDTVINLIR